MIYSFDNTMLDTNKLELVRDGAPMMCEPQVFALVVYLIQNNDRVVSKDELIEAVWDGRIVSDATLHSRINGARRALGDTGKIQAVIRTFPRRGFRFVAELISAGVDPLTGEQDIASLQVPSEAQFEARVATDKPTVAVLSFENMSNNVDQDYLASGMTEDIITGLTKYRWLSVPPRNVTAAYKGKSSYISIMAEELGADFIVEGSVRKMGQRLRVTAQLVDAVTRKNIWAERYDRDLEDIFIVQNEITETITATIEPEMAAFKGQRAGQKPTQSLDAWDCYHLGLSKLYRFSKENNLEAQQLFRKAIEIDPNFGPVYARLAHAMALSAFYFDVDPTSEFLDDALRFAKQAAKFDSQDAGTHFVIGRVHLARGEYDLSIAELQTAIDLNPCLAQAHCGLGDTLACAGRPDESISSFDESIRLSPRDPYLWGFMTYGAMARLFMKQYETAAEWARNAVRVPNSHFWANAILVAILGHMDRPEETQAAVIELIGRKPEFSLQFAKEHLFYIKDAAQMDHYIAGLRKAGIPD